MVRIVLAIMAAGALVVSGIGSSRAADIEQGPYGPYGVQPAPPPYVVEPPAGPYASQPPEEVPAVERYAYGGYSYCWFPGGWRGPGWYVCDHGPWVSGRWWGGPIGWRGWAWRGGPRYYAFRGPRYGGPGGFGWHGGMRGGY